MSPPELPPGTATNPAQSICCVYVLAAAILAMVLLGYCCILRRFSGALCGSCGSTRSEDPNAGDPTEEIRYIVEIPDANEPAEEIHSVGLEFVILESLRVSEFRKSNEGEHSEGSVGCAVCLDEFEEGQLLRHLPNCSHAFHLPCIDTWFESHSNCPVCRSTAYDLTIHGEYSPSAVQGDAIYESSSSETAFDSPSGPAS